MGTPCDWEGCDRPAVSAVEFRYQFGHVHDCGPHVAYLREWADVERVRDLPCPWGCDGTEVTLVQQPRALT